jgi:hypothetical protein
MVIFHSYVSLPEGKSQGGMNQQKFDACWMDVPKTLEGFGGFQ